MEKFKVTVRKMNFCNALLLSKSDKGNSKNSEFAQMPPQGDKRGAEKISPRRICGYMPARNFFCNTAVGMKSGFLEMPARYNPHHLN
jgi:hypothetical protein